MAATGTSKLPPNGVPLFLSLSAHLRACTQWLLSSCPFSGTASRRTNTLLPCVCVCVCVCACGDKSVLSYIVCVWACICMFVFEQLGGHNRGLYLNYSHSQPTNREAPSPSYLLGFSPPQPSLARPQKYPFVKVEWCVGYPISFYFIRCSMRQVVIVLCGSDYSCNGQTQVRRGDWLSSGSPPSMFPVPHARRSGF